MAYSKTSWTDGTTPVNASNMNKVEDALSDQDSRIDACDSRIDACSTKIYSDDADDFVAQVKALGTYQPAPFASRANASNMLMNSSNSLMCVGVVMNGSNNYFNYIIAAPSNGGLYFGRYTYNSGLTYLYKATATSQL